MTTRFRAPTLLATSVAILLAACGGSGGSSSTPVTPPVTPAAPGAPTLASATAGNASATLVFAAPASAGSSALTGYRATCAAGAASLTASGTASPLTVAGLSNGTAYSCTVAAQNSVGFSVASGALGVTPQVPAVPANSTAGVLCATTSSGTQRLTYADRLGAVDETLAFNVAWSCDAATRRLSGNSVPNHEVTGGVFATRLAAQTTAYNFTLTPAQTGMTTVRTPAYAINGVRFEPGTAGTCPDSATSDANCNYAGGGPGTWKMEAVAGTVSPWKFVFGTDANNAHTQPNGEYHYHAVPTGLLAKANPNNASSMTLIGFATDGFPIYARLGYSVATDKNSALKNLTGSYRVKAAPDANRPSINFFPMGHFAQDWEYVAGSGDLDECNGRVGVTPEFPNGIYHYMTTDSYPFVQRCVKGTVPAGT